ncbi:MAG: hypothetical protein BWK76_02420 [Desulfobulbaceae bacterium A2]|nr:MAG: hypothetical protein BWK76_02420 [Desulfobulbaceae bacterium A2]
MLMAMLPWLGLVSLVTFVGSLLLVPWLVARLPVDYFLRQDQRQAVRRRRHPLLVPLLAVGRNLLGMALLLAGIAMLFLPGQGLLTMLLGLSLMDFPGKHQLRDRLLRQPQVEAALNWLRRRAGRPPFVFDVNGGDIPAR